MGEFRYASVITKRASGLLTEQTPGVPNEWAVKVVSESGTQSTTLIRYKGESARSDSDTVYQLLARVFEILGLEP